MRWAGEATRYGAGQDHISMLSVLGKQHDAWQARDTAFGARRWARAHSVRCDGSSTALAGTARVTTLVEEMKWELIRSSKLVATGACPKAVSVTR